MSDNPGLGFLLPNTWRSRDAVHVAIVPVEAGEFLSAGQHVGIVGGLASSAAKHIGVVDPFLPDRPSAGRAVCKGEFFWLMLYPGTVASLRHEWSHPDFPSATAATSEEKIESEAWLANFFGTWFKDGDYNVRVPMHREEIEKVLRGEAGTIYGREARDVPPEFWFHLERLTGRQVHPNQRESFFACMC